MPVRGYGTGDTRALQSGWTTVAPDTKTKLIDDAIAMLARERGIPANAVKLKDISIEIDTKNATEEGKRAVKIKMAVDAVIIGYYSGYDAKIVVSRITGDTKVPYKIFYTNRPSITPLVLMKDTEYEFLFNTDANAQTDLLLAGIQIGEIPEDLVQYSITGDTGVA